MLIEERRVDNSVLILDLKGKMTLGEGDILLAAKIAELVMRKERRIVLNLEKVPYIDAGGFGEIMRTYTTLKRNGGRLRLLNVSKQITDLLVITKLIRIFDSYDTEESAVSSFS